MFQSFFLETVFDSIHGEGGSKTTWKKIVWLVALHIFYFRPYLREMIQFDEHIFQRGWFNRQLVIVESTVPGEQLFSHMLHGTGIFTYIYYKSKSNVGRHSIHGAFGFP